MKPCPLCNQDLPIGDFGICRARKDGRNLYCKSCVRARVNEHRRTLREFKRMRRNTPILVVHVERKPVIPAKLKPIDRVRHAISSGCRTWVEIQTRTRLSEDEISETLPQLLLWEKSVVCYVVKGERIFVMRAA